MRKILVAALAVVVGVLIAHAYLVRTVPDPRRPILWGMTFSNKFARELGLDWKKSYVAMLDDLGAKHVRLAAYWDDVEPRHGQFSFDDLDFEIDAAAAHDADVVLAVGVKAPRWPECYYPSWTGELSDSERRAAILSYVTTTVARYKDNPAIRYLQIENEPYLPFGRCIHQDIPGLLKEEIRAVKNIDSRHPVIVTGSIFVDLWYAAAKRGDLFGTSLYRRIYTDRFGYTTYPFPPSYFRIKSALVHFLLGDKSKKFIVIEMQAEPWVKGGLPGTTPEVQLEHFDQAYFEDSVRYANEAGFNEYYLWGSEWWYWMREKHAHPEFWNYAKTLFASSRS